MPKSNSEKIDDLYRIAYSLTERVDSLRDDVNGHGAEIANVLTRLGIIETRLAVIEQQITHSKPMELKTDVSLLNEKVKDLQTNRDQFANRLWMVIPPIVGAVVSGVIAAAVAYSIASK